MALKFANNAESVLASSINSTQTSIILQSGQGARFPTLGIGDYFIATLVDAAGNLEIVRVIARVADTLTVLRGQEGTIARSFAAGSYIGNQATAAQFSSFFNTDNDGAGSGLDADLLDGRQSSTTAVANTVPVRDANGDLPGNITGNAATATTATTATNVSGGSVSATTLSASGSTTLQSVSATTLTTTGNSTLGDATSDSHTINGSLSVTNTLNSQSISATGTITASGNITAFSDARLKTDWAALDGVLEKARLVQRGSYTRLDTGARECGVSAQDLQKILPEAVVATEDGTLSVAYGNAALVLVLELIDEVERLKKRLGD